VRLSASQKLNWGREEKLFFDQKEEARIFNFSKGNQVKEAGKSYFIVYCIIT